MNLWPNILSPEIITGVAKHLLRIKTAKFSVGDTVSCFETFNNSSLKGIIKDVELHKVHVSGNPVFLSNPVDIEEYFRYEVISANGRRKTVNDVFLKSCRLLLTEKISKN